MFLKPYPWRIATLILLFTASTRALETPSSMDRRIPSRLRLTFRESSTNRGMRLRHAQASQRAGAPRAPRRVAVEDGPERLLEQVSAPQRSPGAPERAERGRLARGEVLGVLGQGEPEPPERLGRVGRRPVALQTCLAGNTGVCG